MRTKMGNLIYFVLDWQAQSQPSLARYNYLVCTLALIHTSDTDTILHSPTEAWQGSSIYCAHCLWSVLFWTVQPSLAEVNYLVWTLSLIRKIQSRHSLYTVRVHLEWWLWYGRHTQREACTEKKVSDIPVSCRYVTNQTLPGRELLNYSRPGKVW